MNVGILKESEPGIDSSQGRGCKLFWEIVVRVSPLFIASNLAIKVQNNAVKTGGGIIHIEPPMELHLFSSLFG